MKPALAEEEDFQKFHCQDYISFLKEVVPEEEARCRSPARRRERTMCVWVCVQNPEILAHAMEAYGLRTDCPLFPNHYRYCQARCLGQCMGRQESHVSLAELQWGVHWRSPSFESWQDTDGHQLVGWNASRQERRGAMAAYAYMVYGKRFRRLDSATSMMLSLPFWSFSSTINAFSTSTSTCIMVMGSKKPS